MQRIIRRALVAAALLIVSTSAHAQKSPTLNLERGNLAVQGYDVVAYAAQGAAVRGRAEYEYRWNGAVWRFSTAAHRDLFAAAPERYAPQYGGYCAWAVSRGYTADVDPEAWRIVDGKLYLNYSKRVQKTWEGDITGNIAKANANWPQVLAR
jgi:hypothetical protein